MNIKINRDTLLKPLSSVSGIVERRHTLPILSNLLLEVKNMALEITSFLIFLFVGLIAGWLADIFVKGISFGLIGDLIVGVIGAFIGGFLFSLIGIGGGGILWSIFAAFIGAIILLVIIRLIRRP